MMTTGRLLSFFFVLLSLGCSAAKSTADTPVSQQAIAAANAPGFRPLRLGGGGYVVDLDFSRDGRTRVVRTDVHGAYIWDEAADEWKQLITATSLPAGDLHVRVGGGVGVYAIRVAPGDSSRLYMVAPAPARKLSHVYRSDDRGAHWVQTNFPPVEMTVQSNGRMLGPKMAIDPGDPNLVLVGDTAGRIHRTQDGGISWTTVDSHDIPGGAEPAIAFAERARGDRRPSEIYVATGLNGVYRSIDGGFRWTRTEGGPRSIGRLVSARDGLYATDRDGTSLENAWKLTGNHWTRLPIASPGKSNGWHSIAVNPADPRHVVLGSTAGNITTSSDGGKTWAGFFNKPAERTASDVPWLAWTPENWMSNGNMMFDPVVPNRLYFAEGIGVWHTQPPRGAAKPTWVSQTRGIEELIVNDLVVPPGGKPIIAVQDRGVFRVENPEVFPARHGPDKGASIRHVWSLDYAAGDPSFIAYAGSASRAGYSRDGGRTWFPFASNTPVSPPGNVGGTIAVSSSSNMVWAPANNGRPFYTTNGGRSWQLAVFPTALPTTGELGWSFSLYQNRHVFAADRVLPGTFYAYNYGPSKAVSVAGTYRSNDGGATWRKTSDGFGIPGSMGTSARLTSVPGNAGHLFFAVGTTSKYDRHPHKVPLKRSRDGGQSWQDIPNTQEVRAIGFGKAAPSKTYPTIFIAGYANGDKVPALYRSTDEGVSWQKLVSYPAGNIDTIRAISGDMNAYGRLYYGFAGSGAGYAVIAD